MPYPAHSRVGHSFRHALPLSAAWLLTLALLVATVDARAQEEEAENVLYIPLAEPLVVNYGGPGRLKYLRAELIIRIAERSDASVIRHHMPLIRHTMVMLFSRQNEEEVNSQQGREELRQLALEEINQRLAEEEGREDIARDLLFNNFVVQR